jgi:hypothetical protein
MTEIEKMDHWIVQGENYSLTKEQEDIFYGKMDEILNHKY